MINPRRFDSRTLERRLELLSQIQDHYQMIEIAKRAIRKIRAELNLEPLPELEAIPSQPT